MECHKPYNFVRIALGIHPLYSRIS